MLRISIIKRNIWYNQKRPENSLKTLQIGSGEKKGIYERGNNQEFNQISFQQIPPSNGPPLPHLTSNRGTGPHGKCIINPERPEICEKYTKIKQNMSATPSTPVRTHPPDVRIAAYRL
jgi:hypothetical protein